MYVYVYVFVFGGSLQQYCDYDDSCAEFRTGYKCGECVDGMTDVGGQCVQCDSTNWAAASFLVFGALLFTVFVVFVDLDVHSPFFLQVPCVGAASLVQPGVSPAGLVPVCRSHS